MASITDFIPNKVLKQFLRQHMKCKLQVVAVSGDHAYGYPNRTSPLELKGIHVEPTENIVGLSQPPRAYSWVEEYEGFRIDFSSMEIGQALSRLLRGDGSILERILAPHQLIKGGDLRPMQRLTQKTICRRFYNHYRKFAKGVNREYEGSEQHTARHILGVYRTALTGIHLLKTGELELDLSYLARIYQLSRLKDLIKIHQNQENAVLEKESPWINRIIKLHTLFEEALETTSLPNDPANPAQVEEYLLDIRRRFFDATTLDRCS